MATHGDRTTSLDQLWGAAGADDVGSRRGGGPPAVVLAVASSSGSVASVYVLAWLALQVFPFAWGLLTWLSVLWR